jgi:hypothetical protein
MLVQFMPPNMPPFHADVNSQRWTNLDEKRQNTLGNKGLFGKQWTGEI